MIPDRIWIHHWLLETRAQLPWMDFIIKGFIKGSSLKSGIQRSNGLTEIRQFLNSVKVGFRPFLNGIKYIYQENELWYIFHPNRHAECWLFSFPSAPSLFHQLTTWIKTGLQKSWSTTARSMTTAAQRVSGIQRRHQVPTDIASVAGKITATAMPTFMRKSSAIAASSSRPTLK